MNLQGMNYYEEFGIRYDASIREIRKAHKLMARLLHPDGQRDPILKRMADQQMKRVGEIFAVLDDPLKRSRYDDILLNKPRRADFGQLAVRTPHGVRWSIRSPIGELARRSWLWLLMSGFLMGLGTWSFLQDRFGASDIESQTDSSGNLPTSAAVADRRPIAGNIGATVSPTKGVNSAQTTIHPEREPAFQRWWLYLPRPRDSREHGRNQAKLLELLLVDDDGQLTGDYRGPYNVPEQGVPPDMNFDIHGTSASAKSGKVTRGINAKARGRTEATAHEADALHIVWWTTKSGQRTAPGSGSAVLTRQPLP